MFPSPKKIGLAFYDPSDPHAGCTPDRCTAAARHWAAITAGDCSMMKIMRRAYVAHGGDVGALEGLSREEEALVLQDHSLLHGGNQLFDDLFGGGS